MYLVSLGFMKLCKWVMDKTSCNQKIWVQHMDLKSKESCTNDRSCRACTKESQKFQTIPL